MKTILVALCIHNLLGLPGNLNIFHSFSIKLILLLLHYTVSDDLIGLFDSPLEDTSSTRSTGLVQLNSTPLLPVSNEPAPLAIMDVPVSQSISFQLSSDITSHPVAPGWDKKVSLYFDSLSDYFVYRLCIQELCRDVQMRITATKILKPDELVIVLILTNQKQSQVNGVSLTVNPPSNVKLSSNDKGSDLTWKGDIEGFGNVRSLCIHHYFY